MEFAEGTRVKFQPRYAENYGFAPRQLIGITGTVEAGHTQPGDNRVPIRYESGSLYLADPRDVVHAVNAHCFAAWIDGELVSVNNMDLGFCARLHELPNWKHISRPDYWRGERNSVLVQLSTFEADYEQQREEEIDEQLAEDELLAHQGYTRQDELKMAAYYEEQEREHELEMQHGGRRRCEQCGQFEVEARVVSTGYDQSEFTKCRDCGHETFAG